VCGVLHLARARASFGGSPFVAAVLVIACGLLVGGVGVASTRGRSGGRFASVRLFAAGGLLVVAGTVWLVALLVS
jgi:hypothetical protein